MAKYKIKSGKRVIGFASSGNSIGGAWAHIFLDCIRCDQSIGLRFDSNEEADQFTDVKASKIFKKNGWSIKPTLCSICRKGK